jgi:hypothetical protein
LKTRFPDQKCRFQNYEKEKLSAPAKASTARKDREKENEKGTAAER